MTTMKGTGEKKLKRKNTNEKTSIPNKKTKVIKDGKSKKPRADVKVPSKKDKMMPNRNNKGSSTSWFKSRKPGFKGKQQKPGFKGNKQFENKKLPKETAHSRKQRKLMRQQRKPNYELSYKAKKIWETLRIQNSQMSKKQKVELVDSLMNVVTEYKKNIDDLFFAHDTSRVIQACLKHGSREQRKRIFDELKGKTAVICKNRYSRNIVWKMLKYGTPDERSTIIKSFTKDGYRLIKQNTASDVLEYAYNNHATKKQRDFLVKLLYGRVFRNSENAESSTFAEMMANNPDKKESLLNSFKTALEPFSQKAALKHTIVHKALRDFFQVCDDVGHRTEIIDSLRESLIHIMHTRDGAHVAMECLWHGTKKDRKVIVKTMKEFVNKLCCEEFGHLVLLAAFDCVDDTVLMKKALIQPLMQNIDELIVDKFGRKVLLYLVTFRNSSHFRPSIVQVLKEGDENESSKKSMELRRRELTETASPTMLDYIANNVEEVLFNPSRFVFVDAVYLHCTGDTLPIAQAIVNLINRPFEPDTKDENGRMHVAEDPCAHMVIKRLIKGEYDAVQGENKEPAFSHLILDEVPVDTLVSWSACNRGTQILLALLESNKEDVSSKARSILKKKQKDLKKLSTFKSSQLLLEKLKNK